MNEFLKEIEVGKRTINNTIFTYTKNTMKMYDGNYCIWLSIKNNDNYGSLKFEHGALFDNNGKPYSGYIMTYDNYLPCKSTKKILLNKYIKLAKKHGITL